MRELRNVVERAAVLVRGGLVAAADIDLPPETPTQAPDRDAADDWLSGDMPGAVARLERAMIAAALRESDGNRARAARRLGIQRQLLYAKIERYGLAAPGVEVSEDTTPDVGNPDAFKAPDAG